MHYTHGLKARVALAVLAAVLAISPAHAATPAAAPTTAPAAVKVTLQARLFYARSGTFSADALAPGGPELGNIVIRDDPSTSTFVVVAVSVPDGQEMPFNSSIRLVAREPAAKRAAARTLVDRSVTLVGGRKGGTTHVGFWLPDTGCRTVELRATMTAARKANAASAQAMLPFVCNE